MNARSSSLLDRPTDDQLFSLAGFLSERPCGRRALGLEELHGFLTALHCVPGPLVPAVWLPVVFGGDVERIAGRRGVAMTGVALGLSIEIARSLFDSTNQEIYEPLIAFPGTCERVSPAAWCDGFLRGLDLKLRGWVEHLEEDEDMRRVLCPIIALSTRFRRAAAEDGMLEAVDFDEDELEAMLPLAVVEAYTWWRLGAPSPAFAAATAMASAAT